MSTMERMLRSHPEVKELAEHDESDNAFVLSEHEEMYVELLTDYCALTGMEDADALLTGEEFDVNGVQFRLNYLPDLQPDMLGVLCDLGEVEEELEEQRYRELLEENALRYDGISPVMALCPETGLALYSARLPLATLSAETLKELMETMAREAMDWQKGKTGGGRDV